MKSLDHDQSKQLCLAKTQALSHGTPCKTSSGRKFKQTSHLIYTKQACVSNIISTMENQSRAGHAGVIKAMLD